MGRSSLTGEQLPTNLTSRPTLPRWGAPNQRVLNENNNGLLRRDGLHKGRDLRHLADEEVAQIMSYRNNIPRKSLGYQTSYEVFMKYVTDEQLLFF